MHTTYEYLTQSDIDALQAEAAYYDQLAQEQAAAPQPQPPVEWPPVNYLALAERHLDDYERKSINEAQYSTDRAYRLALLNAGIAQAQAATRQAEVMESLLEYIGELIGGTNLLDALTAWSYRQKAG